MPRTVMYDLKSSYGTLRKINALYEIVEEEDSQPQALWYIYPSSCVYSIIPD